MVAVSSAPPALALDEVAPAPPRRPRVLLVATSMAALAAVVAFAALIGAYVSIRHASIAAGDPWLDDFSIPLPPPNMGMATLAMSAVTGQWAVYAAARRDRRHTYLALGVTILLGAAFVNQIAFFWQQSEMALNGEAATTATTLFLTITGLQVAMTAAGLVFWLLMALRTLGGQFTGKDAEGISAAALFWYATIGVYSVIWYALFIVK